MKHFPPNWLGIKILIVWNDLVAYGFLGVWGKQWPGVNCGGLEGRSQGAAASVGIKLWV